jgi:hypothetical protein
MPGATEGKRARSYTAQRYCSRSPSRGDRGYTTMSNVFGSGFRTSLWTARSVRRVVSHNCVDDSSLAAKLARIDRVDDPALVDLVKAEVPPPAFQTLSFVSHPRYVSRRTATVRDCSRVRNGDVASIEFDGLFLDLMKCLVKRLDVHSGPYAARCASIECAECPLVSIQRSLHCLPSRHREGWSWDRCARVRNNRRRRRQRGGSVRDRGRIRYRQRGLWRPSTRLWHGTERGYRRSRRQSRRSYCRCRPRRHSWGYAGTGE